MYSASAVGASIVRGCVVEGSVLDGIQVANNVLVSDNSLSNNSVNDLHVTGGGNRIDGNNIVKTGDKAIKVDIGQTNVIVRNSVKGVLSDIDIPAGNAKGPAETAGTPLGNPWANIFY
jgi:hydrogenase maturation factor HypE